ncbi:hypothetical protein T12_9168 [Trichinella patagoniensis]|uniref:Uncharacterized protein n=1 Tax=Trichinella patagoniensis TaxID=990121 RepID=A0A0V0YVM0_9BILA|nr:hypothetical protein T12_9168 [Trichinella patagoniensis]
MYKIIQRNIWKECVYHQGRNATIFISVLYVTLRALYMNSR